MEIRLETAADYSAVEELTREAFWNLYQPGCDEHYLAHILRAHQDFLPDLDYVAEADGRIVGSIMYSRSWLFSEGEGQRETVSFGPLCIHPEYQRKGIGSLLIRKTVDIVRKKGIPAITI